MMSAPCIPIVVWVISLLSSSTPISAFSQHNFGFASTITSLKHGDRSRSHNSHLYLEPLASGRVLPPEYFKSVYDRKNSDDDDDTDVGDEESESTIGGITPWDIGNGKPQPAIVTAYEKGQLRGRIIDAGCGAGEGCIYLAGKYGVTSVFGCDLAEGGIRLAEERVLQMIEGRGGTNVNSEQKEETNEKSNLPPFWTRPTFFVASCTEMADEYQKLFGDPTEKEELFDVSIDSGLLHCLSDDDARRYVKQLGRLLKPGVGRAYVGCFSTKNPAESWDNPRRLSPDYLRQLFCKENGWEVISIQDTWWARPPGRGSSQGAFSMALWMEARRME